jgi:hypothetical protein
VVAWWRVEPQGVLGAVHQPGTPFLHRNLDSDWMFVVGRAPPSPNSILSTLGSYFMPGNVSVTSHTSSSVVFQLTWVSAQEGSI